MVMVLKSSLAALLLGAATLGAASGWFWTRPQPVPFIFVPVTLEAGIQLQVSRDEITTGVWSRCHDAGDCTLSFIQAGAPKPVTGVNPEDIGQFVGWLNAETKSNWRLPTVVEQRSFGLPRITDELLFSDPRMAWAASYNMKPAYSRTVFETGHFGSAPNGLRDVSGNVWEWTSSCVNARVAAAMCPAFYVGGDHEAEIPVFLRDAYSGGCSAGAPPTHLGFRLVRDL